MCDVQYPTNQPINHRRCIFTNSKYIKSLTDEEWLYYCGHTPNPPQRVTLKLNSLIEDWGKELITPQEVIEVLSNFPVEQIKDYSEKVLESLDILFEDDDPLLELLEVFDEVLDSDQG